MPIPLSVIAKTAMPPWTSASTSTTGTSSQNLSALPIRFRKTWRSLRGSPRIAGSSSTLTSPLACWTGPASISSASLASAAMSTRSFSSSPRPAREYSRRSRMSVRALTVAAVMPSTSCCPPFRSRAWRCSSSCAYIEIVASGACRSCEVTDANCSSSRFERSSSRERSASSRWPASSESAIVLKARARSPSSSSRTGGTRADMSPSARRPAASATVRTGLTIERRK